MKPTVITALLAATLSLGSLHAQEESRGPDSMPRVHVPGVDLLNIPDAAFSARSDIEWTRVLEDGGTVILQSHAILARDASGRTYREHHSFVPAGKRSPLNSIDIYDPVAHTHSSCDTHTLRCVVVSYKARTAFVSPQQGASRDGSSYLERQELGADRVEGIDVVGSRETLTIRAGAFGNSSPLVTMREFWFSPQLKTNLAVTRDGAKEGKQVVRLSDFAISDPKPELFRIPQGYTIDDRTQSPDHPRVLGKVFGKSTQ